MKRCSHKKQNDPHKTAPWSRRVVPVIDQTKAKPVFKAGPTFYAILAQQSNHPEHAVHRPAHASAEGKHAGRVVRRSLNPSVRTAAVSTGYTVGRGAVQDRRSKRRCPQGSVFTTPGVVPCDYHRIRHSDTAVSARRLAAYTRSCQNARYPLVERSQSTFLQPAVILRE
jgi:hypothetical protein